MQNEVFPAAEKILFDIESIIRKDLNVISFEIVPAEDDSNKSPVFHDANSLGLASWCVQPLYCYVHNRLLDLRRYHFRREESTVILRWLLGALLLNPDVSTFWNMKREFTRNGKLDPVEELRFVNIILYCKAKCFEAFSYRHWILKLLITKNRNLICNLELLFQNEIQIVSLAADHYGNNCHAWNHRKQILSMIEIILNTEFHDILEKEWLESTRWCNWHISDYSGFTYRQFLLKKLLLYQLNSDQWMPSFETLKERKGIILEFIKVGENFHQLSFFNNSSAKDILDFLHGVHAPKYSDLKFEQTLYNLSFWAEDCLLNEELINHFPGHECLWYHRRFLVCSLLALNNSFENYFIYCKESFNLSRFRDFIETRRKQPLLITVFNLRNKKLIDNIKKYGKYENNLAERFSDFLIKIKLEPSDLVS